MKQLNLMQERVDQYEEVNNCPVCISIEQSIYIRTKSYQLLKCKNCNLVYQSPRKKEALLSEQYIGNISSRSEYYDSTFTIDKETFKERLLKTFELINMDPKGKMVLDIGCNIGAFLSAAKDVGLSPLGVEPNPSAATLCKEKGFHVVNTFFSKKALEGMENAFALIHLGDIAEHVTTPLELIKTVREFVKPGGYILISTPNIDSILARIFQIKPDEHILYFNSISLLHLIRLAQLTPMKMFITSRKRDFKSFKYSTSFNNWQNKFILNVVTFFGIGELVTEILKHTAKDELFLIAKKN